jgi:antitoxin HicB
MTTRNKHLGSSYEDFLKDEGIHEEATTHAIKRVLAWQITEAMKAKRISKSERRSACRPAEAS